MRPGGEGGREVAAGDKVLLLLVLLFALIEQLLFGMVPDDAFVTFRYADNIAAGHGAVFNVGDGFEGPPNFLWLILVTLPKALFGLDVARSATVLSVLCVLGCVVLAYRLGGRFGLPAAVLTSGASGLAAYGLAGTETALFVLLLLAVVGALATGHAVVAGVLAALAMMTRPEGVVPAVLAVIWLIVGAARRRWSWWTPLADLLGLLVFVVPWLVWRATYYDEPLTGRSLMPFTPFSYGFLAVTLAAVGIARVCQRRARPSPSPRRGPLAVSAVALSVCAVSLPISAATWPDVAERRALVAETEEIGAWLADRVQPGSVIATGRAALAYTIGTRLVAVGESLAAVRWPDMVAYSATRDCAGYAGFYESATFQRVGTGAWVTVYPRQDQFGKLVERLSADPRMTYVPCP